METLDEGYIKLRRKLASKKIFKIQKPIMPPGATNCLMYDRLNIYCDHVEFNTYPREVRDALDEYPKCFAEYEINERGEPTKFLRVMKEQYW